MTSADLRAWQAHMGFTFRAAAAALDVSLASYASWMAGVSNTTKKPIQIDRRTALACAALAAGVKPWAEEATTEPQGTP